MRLLFLAPQPFFQPRGTPLAERAVLEVLAARGYEIDLLTYHEGEDLEIPNCRIHRIRPPARVRDLRPGFSSKKLVCDAIMLAECLRMVRRRRFNLVHAVEEAAFIGAAVKRLFGIPFIYDMDSSLPQQMIDRFGWLRTVRPVLEGAERLAVRESLGILAVCKALEEQALRHDARKLIARAEDVSLLRTDLNGEERIIETIGRQGPIVMYVGNLAHYQGMDLLLAGFVHARREIPEVQLVVIGGSETDIRHYRAEAVHLGIGDQVHFLGPRPVALLGYYLQQADVLVSPRSRGSNTPMKIYSYLDSGTAVLATRLPTHTQVLDDEIALLVEPQPAAFGEGLVRLLQDPTLRRALALQARERVRREYSAEAFHRKVNTFYDSIERQLGLPRPLASVETLSPHV